MTEEMTNSRGIETITAEIVAIRGYAQRVVLSAAIEIGRRLVEAKEILPYGEWGNWLKESVAFSQATATRYMKLFEEYADKQQSIFGAETEFTTLQNLSVSNALKLLAVPEEEREEFAIEHDVEHLSSRQMDELMAKLEQSEKDKNEALDTLEEARRERDDAQYAVEEVKENLEKAQKEADALREQVKALEDRPIEVAVQEPDPDKVQAAVDAAVQEQTATLKAKEKDLKQKLKEAEAKQKELETQAAETQQRLEAAEQKLQDGQSAEADKQNLEREVERLKKELSMADGAVASFQVLFEQSQQVLNRLISAMEPVTDAQTKAKLQAATKKMLEIYSGKVENDV
jgi:chromosome segregation ATPase